MKVAIVTNYWKNSEGGGIKTYLENLVNTLTERSVDVRVIFRQGHDQEQFQGNTTKFAFSVSSYRHLLEFRPDAIHTQGDWYCLLPAVLYKRTHECNVINTFHTEPEESAGLAERVIMQYLLNACDHVTFVSMGLKRRTLELDQLSLPNSVVTYAGATVKTVTSEEVQEFRERFDIRDDAIVLLASGMTAIPYKAAGLKILMQALIQLRSTFPTIVLIVTREGGLSPELKAFASEIGVEEQVIFTGDIENPFVPLKLCDIYTHITLGDGLPVALLEAMSMGKPIIATPIAGIPEAITNKENGLLVEPEVQQIVEGIALLLHNREYAEELGRCAKKTADEKFTWTNSAKVFESLYAS